MQGNSYREDTSIELGDQFNPSQDYQPNQSYSQDVEYQESQFNHQPRVMRGSREGSYAGSQQYQPRGSSYLRDEYDQHQQQPRVMPRGSRDGSYQGNPQYQPRGSRDGSYQGNPQYQPQAVTYQDERQIGGNLGNVDYQDSSRNQIFISSLVRALHMKLTTKRICSQLRHHTHMTC